MATDAWGSQGSRERDACYGEIDIRAVDFPRSTCRDHDVDLAVASPAFSAAVNWLSECS